MAKTPDAPILENMQDKRSGAQKEIVVFSPVGDIVQFEGFCRHVHELGIDMEADFVFVCKKGLVLPKCSLSALYAYEKYPLGTSGSFFAGAALCHALGYPLVFIADLDALLDSKNTFDEMARLAQEKNSAVVPLSKSSSGDADEDYFVINQWAVLPAAVFETTGFAIPYTWKGGEDYEFTSRLLHDSRLSIFRQGCSIHPRSGSSIYEKMQSKGKYYPYVNGLMKAFLFASSYKKSEALKFLFWHSFYFFFADIFNDAQLKGALSNPILSNKPIETVPNTAFTLQKGAHAAKMPQGTLAKLAANAGFLLSLLVRGRAIAFGDEVSLLMPRWKFLLSLFLASLFSPIRLLQGVQKILAWSAGSKEFPFPPTPANLPAVFEWCAKRYGTS